MTANEFLAHLDLVRQCGDKRWVARCPAHLDEHPSLAVAQGEHAILVRCWAGCTFTEIVQAVGLNPHAMFYKSKRSSRKKSRDITKRFLNPKELGFRLKLYADELWLRGDGVLTAARDLHPSEWTNDEMDRAINIVADAYENRAKATVLEELAIALRFGRLPKEKPHAS